MKKYLLIILFFPAAIYMQEYKLVNDGDNNKVMLVGISPQEAYQDSNFSLWYNSEYTNYDVDINTISAQNVTLEGKTIKIVLGTWCSDSRREVPRFVKILDFMGFPKDKRLYINVDREKKGLTDEVEGLEIEFVPTFIVYENGVELGRIIEMPYESLEKDLIEIVKSSN
jgi:hypothetical protein